MKSIFINYCKLFRRGFFIKSTLFALLIIVIEPLKSQSIVDSYIMNSITLMLRCLLFLIFISEISKKKFVLASMLPIKIKEFIGITYLHTYLMTFMIFTADLLVTFAIDGQLSKGNFIINCAFLLSFNILYPFYANPEMKLGVDQGSETNIFLIGIMFLVIFSNFAELLAEEMYSHQVLIYKLIFSLVFVIASIFTVKKSYNNTVNKILALE